MEQDEHHRVPAHPAVCCLALRGWGLTICVSQPPYSTHTIPGRAFSLRPPDTNRLLPAARSSVQTLSGRFGVDPRHRCSPWPLARDHSSMIGKRHPELRDRASTGERSWVSALAAARRSGDAG
jgi:hypothetical protein